MNDSVTTVQVSRARWSVIENGRPVGAIGPSSAPGGRGPARTVWVVIAAGQGVDIDAVRHIPYLHPSGAVQAVLDVRKAHDRAQQLPGLDGLARRLLDFERAYWAVPATARLRQATKVFGLDADAYLDAIRDLVESTNPAYREYAPDVINRLAHLLAHQPRHRTARPA